MAHVAVVSGVIRTNRASKAKSTNTQPNKYEFRLTVKEEEELLPLLKETEYTSVRALGPTYTYDPVTHILSPRSATVTAIIKEYRKEQESAAKLARKTAKSARKTAKSASSRLRRFFTGKRKSTTAGGRKRRQRRRTRKQRRRN